ncbi:hypothetical protein M6B38_268050 [Iris pallida]|uniref:Uncharacterized protein n=1 Tax=Iris pallida TaxID=29817 RepID=A0AAX6I8K6_IRIPA|nr:hypothetical protein M6B38_238920 [Iris pallida]KAJ6849650.1 hypothetical protein M6B38_268050 [Iris pallida]
MLYIFQPDMNCMRYIVLAPVMTGPVENITDNDGDCHTFYGAYEGDIQEPEEHLAQQRVPSLVKYL